MVSRLSTQVFLMLVMGCVSVSHAATLPLNDFKVSSYQGEVLYVDFWASWCIPCKASFPWMNEMQKKYAGKLHMVAVNLDPERADADKFLKKYPATFPIIYDPDGTLAEKYEVRGMPTAILFDRKGNIVFKHVGFRKGETEGYENKIKQQLNLVP